MLNYFNCCAVDPRMWSRDDVTSFLRWFEREFELPTIDLSKFCMNGKALCMLTKSDLADRAPGAGDILHNTLQFLLRDAPQVPQSPITPHHPLLSPSPLTSSPVQPWSLMSPDIHSFTHLLHQGGSVTLSPAPSEQSGGSPRHPDTASSTSSTSTAAYHHSSAASTGSAHSGSQSDSEDSTRDSSSPQRSPLPPNNATAVSAFPAHALASLKHLTECRRAVAAAAAVNSVVNSHQEGLQQHQHSHQLHHQHQHHSQPPLPPLQPQGQTGPSEEPVETGTNGRLLWDFLQQLLNDPQQRYSRYIAWKNRDTGVFKIVDPPGLARLWGIQKNHLSMNYDKMSRALRYYYRVNILRKVQGERHCYQFLRNPSELKSIKNISMLRSTPLQSPRSKDTPAPVQPAPMEEEEGPTDLSMSSIHHQYHAPAPAPMDTHPQNLNCEPHNLSVTVKTEEYLEHSYE
ncbi:ets DNA-binding protein pokkuri-like isoform X2 [Homarus americanus]|uniref:ets DNA-binding protein pokkuri-like isoform X2 n=1 Tax=Homarus americanus TaxID=6706 RepID=UPI001C46499B|nr:ets DNA-binding protein pokkuri-like isoform X2 [Homarus americanus]